MTDKYEFEPFDFNEEDEQKYTETENRKLLRVQISNGNSR